MTLPTSGPLLASMINAEIGRAGNAYFHLNGTQERLLAGVPTGQVDFSDFYGKRWGFPTPDADYPDPNTLTATQIWSSTTTDSTVILAFGTTGTITVTGTPGAAIPALWYQDNPPPAGYSIMYSLVSSVTTGDPDVRTSIQFTDTWIPIIPGGSVVPLYAQISKSSLPTMSSTLTVAFDVLLSNGSSTIVTFRLTCDVTLTP